MHYNNFITKSNVHKYVFMGHDNKQKHTKFEFSGNVVLKNLRLKTEALVCIAIIYFSLSTAVVSTYQYKHISYLNLFYQFNYLLSFFICIFDIIVIYL